MDEEFPEPVEGMEPEAIETSSPASGGIAETLGKAAYEAHKNKNQQEDLATDADDNPENAGAAESNVGHNEQGARPERPQSEQGQETRPDPAQGSTVPGEEFAGAPRPAEAPAAGGPQANQGKAAEQFADRNAGGPRGAKGGDAASGGAQARPTAGGTAAGGMGGAEEAAGKGADAASKGADAVGKGADAAEGAADAASNAGGAGKANVAKQASRVAEGAKEEGAVGATDAALQGAAVTAANVYAGPVGGAAADAILQTEVGQQATRLVTYGVLGAVVVVATVIIMMISAAVSGFTAILSVKASDDQKQKDSLSCTSNGVPSITDPETISIVKEIMQAAADKSLGADATIIPVMVGITESQLDPYAVDPLQPLSTDKWLAKVGIYQWKPKEWAPQEYLDSNDVDGAISALRDPYTASGLFYDALPVEWETQDPWVVAKTVQASSVFTATDYLGNLDQAQATVASVLLNDAGLSASLGPLSASTTCSGPVIGAGTGSSTVAPLVVISANIQQGMTDAQWRTAMGTAASFKPDLIAVQEAYYKSEDVYTPNGYLSYRKSNDKNSPFAETPVLWRDDWEMIGTGAIRTSINDLHWGDRAVNWVTARSPQGHTVSIVSVHNLTNPYTGDRYREYGEAMTALQGVVRNLTNLGAVVLPGDYNIGFGEDTDPTRTNWPRLKYQEVGVTSTYASLGPLPTGAGGGVIDYIWYTENDGLTLKSQQTYDQVPGTSDDDHRGLLARFEMGGVYSATDFMTTDSAWLVDRADYARNHPAEACGGSCYQMCQHLAAWVWGYTIKSGYGSAKIAWYDLVAKGYAHPGDRNPPVGAVLYWNNGDYGHAAIYVGNGYEQSNYPTAKIERRIWTNVMPTYYVGWSPGIYPATRTQPPPKDWQP